MGSGWEPPPGLSSGSEDVGSGHRLHAIAAFKQNSLQGDIHRMTVKLEDAALPVIPQGPRTTAPANVGRPAPTAEDDRAFATRLARYCARNPVALERLTYDRAAKAVTYRSDKSDGPTAGTETVDPLAFLARVLVHIPDQGHVTTRYYGWYANRPRGMRHKADPATADGPPAMVAAARLAPTEAARRWATLLQQIFEVDPLVCPSGHGAMRIVACITQTSVIDQILTHLRTRAARAAHAGPRSPPSTRAPASRGASRAPRPFADAPPVP